jgi:predicted nuclease of predicted toxin-antitoxin system
LKILIDQNVSARLGRLLTGHEASHASSMGWAELTNGVLLTAAEADGFEIFLTADKNIRFQQNLTGRGIALVVLDTNQLDILFANIERIIQAIDSTTAGSYVTVRFDRPPLLRRRYNPPTDCQAPEV